MVNQQLVMIAKVTYRCLFKTFGLIRLSSPRIYILILTGEQVNKDTRDGKHICQVRSFMEKKKPRKRDRDSWGLRISS